MVERDRQSDKEARARVKAFRRYLLLAQKPGLPLDEVIAKDFARILAASISQLAVFRLDTLPEGKKDYHFKTSYGPFSYNSERLEGISPLLPEDTSTFLLSVTQGKIFERLLMQPGITVRKNTLFDFIGGEKSKLLTLNVRISNLRERIGDVKDGQGHFRLIHTIHGGGGIYFDPVKPPISF